MIKAGKIMILHQMHGDWPIGHNLVAEPGIYVPFINPHGAVSVEVHGQMLGIKPDEFIWLDKPRKKVYGGQ